MESNPSSSSEHRTASPAFPLAVFLGGLALGLAGGFSIFALIFANKESTEIQITPVAGGQYLMEVQRDITSLFSSGSSGHRLTKARLLTFGGHTATFQVQKARPGLTSFLPQAAHNYELTPPVDPTSGTLSIKIW